MCKTMLYNGNRDGHLHPTKAVFSFILTKTAFVLHNFFNFPIRGMKPATEAAHCRDVRLPVTFFCGRLYIYQGDGHASRFESTGITSNAPRANVHGGVFAHGARFCLRNIARTFAQYAPKPSGAVVGRHNYSHHAPAAAGKFVLDLQSVFERGNWENHAPRHCVGRKFRFTKQVNKFDFIKQAFCGNLLSCRKPALI